MGGKGSGRGGQKVTRYCKFCGAAFECLKSHQTQFCTSECRRKFLSEKQKTDFERVNTRDIFCVAVDVLKGVYEHLQPEIGKVYRATEAVVRGQVAFCYVEIDGKPIIMRKGVKDRRFRMECRKQDADGRTALYTRSEYMEVQLLEKCPICGTEGAVTAYVQGGEIIGCRKCMRLASIESLAWEEDEE